MSPGVPPLPCLLGHPQILWDPPCPLEPPPCPHILLFPPWDHPTTCQSMSTPFSHSIFIYCYGPSGLCPHLPLAPLALVSALSWPWRPWPKSQTQFLFRTGASCNTGKQQELVRPSVTACYLKDNTTLAHSFLQPRTCSGSLSCPTHCKGFACFQVAAKQLPLGTSYP